MECKINKKMNPDGGEMTWNGKDYKMSWSDRNSYPFLIHSRLNFGNIYTGRAARNHLDAIMDYIYENGFRITRSVLHDMHKSCTLLGRVWLFNDDDGCRAVFSAWKYNGWSIGLDARIYNEVCNQLGVIPKEAIYIENNKVIELTFGRDTMDLDSKPIDQKLSGSSMSEAEYRFYRYTN